MKRPTRKILVPATLAAAGTWLLVGCVYIPTFGTRMEGRNAAKSVGSAESRKPLRVRHATLADVVRVLGEPRFASADRRVLAYPWTVRNGVVVWPLCFAAYPVKGHRTLVLRFDEQQVLRSYETLRRDEPLVSFQGMANPTPLPPEVQDQKLMARIREVERWRASTRPATAPATQPR